MKRSTTILMGFLAVSIAGCSSLVGETPIDSSPASHSSTSTDDVGTQPSPNENCVRTTGDNRPISTGALASDALFIAGESFVCANDVVIVGEADINQIAVAAQLAAALEGPLLFPEPRLAAEIGRLKPLRVHIVGVAEVNVPGDAESIVHDVPGAVEAARVALGVSEVILTPNTPDASTVIETVNAIYGRDRVVSPNMTTTGSSTQPGPIAPPMLVAGLARPADGGSTWVVDAASPATILMSSATGSAVGATVIAIDGDNLLAYPEVAAALANQPAGFIRSIGPQTNASAWEFAVLTNGQQVPGGGFTVLPSDGKRRYVAYYGHPETTALGILGEQGPAETLSQMADFVDAYSGDGSQVVPTFEMIASVASAGPGDDGNYSYEWPPDTFDEWIEFARDNDIYVILDLQPGRADFLSQARQYEALLKLPFVGLALDPEWRLKESQVHLEQVGSVDSAEVNEVVNWVADLVRDNGLPQKMMLVHQFRTAMIQNRENIVERPEVQLIVQMDGDGTEPQKDNTYRTLLEGADDAHWAWGWKNFFDEDEPGPPSPESTMSKVPSPVYVSYQ